MSTVSRTTVFLLAVAVTGGGYLKLQAASEKQASPARPALVRSHSAASGAPQTAAPQPDLAAERAVLDKYCVSCHNERRKTANVMFDKLDVAHVTQDAETWEKTVRKLTARAMPPVGSPRPDEATYQHLLSWLETTLDRDAATNPNPGRPIVHRVNRAEYTNAIRDLLGLHIDAAALLPVDESGYGFDNIADVLSVSPSLLQRYLFAAQKISRLAIGDPAMRLDTYETAHGLQQNERMSDALPFRSRGGLAVQHYFPVDGDYLLKIRLLKGESSDGILGLANRERIDVRVDGQQITLFQVGGECVGSKDPKCVVPKGVLMNSVYEQTADEGLEVRFAAKAGPRAISVTFMERNALEPEGLGGESQLATYGRGQMAIDRVEIRGPFTTSGPGLTASRQQLFPCYPTAAKDEEPCAEKVLTTLARRAYRRPPTKDDVDRLLQFYRAGRTQGGFDAGIRFALERVLVSPNFLLRVEADPATATAGKAYRVGDVELASRLSFFLWSSVPDDELLNLAIRGRLHDPKVLEQQVRRMLADERANAMVENFAAQWLYLRDLKKMQPDPLEFRAFNENLREAFMKETELFLEDQMRSDRPLAELLSANHTFLNQRLAEFYGVPNVFGSHFRKVTLPDPNRSGLLGHASLLTVTSYATRTSPVQRGKYILTTFLGSPPPPPPPNVPALKETGEGGTPATVRERMELHRKNPVCAGCHARMDPLGFALENFDGIGHWRDKDAGMPIDPSGQFPDGSKIKGPADFRTGLLKHKEEFVHTFTEKLLTYALGRGAEYYDMPAIRTIMRNAAPDYRWSALVVGIVNSRPFQMKKAADPEPVKTLGANAGGSH